MIKLKSLLFESRKHGFDLTDFKNKGYQVVLKNLDIPPVSKKGSYGWVWKGKDISITTGNNPITGEFFSGLRKNEKDYAGYIGIEGKQDLVKKAVKLIKKYSTYIKDESPGRRDYI